MLAFVLALVAPLAAAQFDPTGSAQRSNTAYLDISTEAASHLRTAASYVSDGNWSEAIDLYDKLIQNFGDKMVQVEATPLYLTVRDYCHIQICRMPSEALALYRRRVDPREEPVYRKGLAERDPALLRRVVARSFASSWGDDALDALAELAFEAGRFDEAHRLWSQLGTGPKNANQEPAAAALVYPGTSLDPALVEAKRVLCRLFGGDGERGQQELAVLRRAYPAARGTLGAAEGVLADRVAAIARDAGRLADDDDAVWRSFAGNAQRSRIAPHAVDIGSVQWTASWPETFQSKPVINRPVPPRLDESPPFHPLVLHDWVIVCGREEVRAYDLHEGAKSGEGPVWSFNLYDNRGYARPTVRQPATGNPQYTMTADQSRLFVRLGAPETTMPLLRVPQPESHSYLVCLDLTAEGKELWRAAPDEPDLAFEGAPVVADGNAYIGVTRGGAMTHAFVDCYDAATGAKKWRKLICEASSAGLSSRGSISHNLLTLGAGTLYYNTNLGAIAALDAPSGSVRWITTYPRDTLWPMTTDGTSSRDLNPCVYHDGLVMVAPSDSQGIYAFDATTGALRWRTTEPPHFVHLLGVAHGNLIATGNHVVAINLETGRRVWQWPEGVPQPAYGRGVLAGNYVYFPTKTHVYVLDQRSGEFAKPPIALVDVHGQTPGNLVVGDGYLVVAQAKGLTVFCQYDVLIQRYKDQIVQEPSSADPHFRLARVAEAAGESELAAEHYRQAVQLARAGESIDGRSVRDAAQGQLYALLLELGRKAMADERWADADACYREAVGTAPSDRARLAALLRRGELWCAAGDGPRALEAYQRVLALEPLHALAVQVDPSRSVRADVVVANRIQELLERYGAAIYEPFDKTARGLFEDAQRSGDLTAADRIVATYPNSTVVPQTLLFLATQHGANHQAAAARSAFKQLLARPDAAPEMRLAALHGLAELLEAERSWHAAQLLWERMAREFPEAALPAKPEQTVSSFVAEHLAGAPYDREALEGSGRLELPVARRWNRTWDKTSRIIIPRGSPPSDEGLLLLVSRPNALECLSATRGEPLWRTELAGTVRWSAYHGEHLLVGSDTQLLSVALKDGRVTWRYAMKPPEGAASELPFGQSMAPSNRPAAGAAPDPASLAEFTLIEDRLYAREGTRRLLCLSASTGATLWSFTPTEGLLLPHTFFSAEHVALRSRLPGDDKSVKFVVLDGDGRRRFELTKPNVPWSSAPVALDSGRLCVSVSARTIELVDLQNGKPIWSFETIGSDRPAQPIVAQGALLILVGGTELIRVDAETGKRLWSAHIASQPIPDAPTAWAVDDHMFYCITREQNLRAFRVDDGTLAWQLSLVGSQEHWQIVPATRHLAVLPDRPDATHELPVVLCRKSDGQLGQRLLFRSHGGDAFVHLARDFALVGTENEVWAVGGPER